MRKIKSKPLKPLKMRLITFLNWSLISCLLVSCATANTPNLSMEERWFERCTVVEPIDLEGPVCLCHKYDFLEVKRTSKSYIKDLEYCDDGDFILIRNSWLYPMLKKLKNLR